MRASELAMAGVFRAADHPVRRATLASLEATTPPVALPDLVEGVERTLAETGTDASIADLELALHHVHLPLLEDAGLVTVDVERRRVDDWLDLGLGGDWSTGRVFERVVATLPGGVGEAGNGVDRTARAAGAGREAQRGSRFANDE